MADEQIDNNEELWNEICFILSENIKPDISESQFQREVVRALEKLGWRQFKKEIIEKISMPSGTSSIEADVIVQSPENSVPFFVIEIKAPNVDSTNKKIAAQLLSYMRQSKCEIGIIIGNMISIIWDDRQSTQTDYLLRGFGKNGEFQKKTKLDRQQILLARNKFRQRVQQAGGVNPIYLKQNVRQLHSRDSLVVETLKKYPQEGLAKSAAKTKWTSDELNNTFSTGWHLPQWTQVRNTTNVLSGCGPLALAMMYAYHRQFTGKTKLFNGLDLNSNVPTPYGTYPASSTMGSYNQIIKDVAFQIGADCGANYGASGTGVNINALENDGELYGDRLGYDVHLDSDFGGDFTKGKTALGHIRGERPCMFQFDSDRNGSVDHYGAIEGVKYMERKYVWNWYNWEMWYLVNYGWGNTRQWICVDAQYSSNATEYKNTGNLYMEWR